MKKIFPFLLLLLFVSASNIFAQKAPADYKITNIKVVPFEQTTGEFEDEFTGSDERSFFNDLGKGLFVTVEITGKPGDYAGTRNLSVTVLEGTKIKLKKSMMSGILNDSGKYYFGFYVEPALCDEITITAKLTGQKTPSTKTRKVPFLCGE